MSPLVLPAPPPTSRLEDLLLGRLALPTVTDPITELLGSNLTVVGDATAVGQRKAKGFTLNLIVAGWSESNPTAAGNRMRRQLRAMVQNAPLRLAGIYMQFAFDTERNGWFVIGAAELADDDGGVTFGSYKLSVSEIYRIAGIPTHREGFRVDVTDMRLTYSPIDYLGQVINTTADFAALTPLALTAAPAGASDLSVLDAPAVSGSRAALGGACPICAGRSNGDVISWERAEASFNVGDVVLYDRRGNLGPFGGATYDASPLPADIQAAYGWEEILGPDYPYSWLTAGNPADVPVLSNGLCRVRYGTTGQFYLDVWNGTTTWAPQGLLQVSHRGAVNAYLVTLISAAVLKWTPERAAVMIVLGSVTDPTARDRVILTLQRGWTGPRVEVYPAPLLSGAAADASIEFTDTLTGITNRSAVKIDAGGAVIGASAGTGSTNFPSGVLGAIGFTAENEVICLRQGAGYQLALAVRQAAPYVFLTGADAGVYSTGGLGYLSAHLGICAQQADQIMEAEAMTLGTGTAATADAAASSGFAATATRTTDANAHVTRAAWPNSTLGKYRPIVRVKVSAGTGSVYAKVTGGAAGATRTTTSTGYVELDLGDVLATGATLEIHAWISTGTGTISVDHIEAPLLEDRTAAVPGYAGARDLGQSVLLEQIVEMRRPERA